MNEARVREFEERIRAAGLEIAQAECYFMSSNASDDGGFQRCSLLRDVAVTQSNGSQAPFYGVTSALK